MVLSRWIASLVVCLSFLLSVSCSKQLNAVASAPDIPTVAVAKVTTEDLAHNLVLTAEFKPFQEIDVMAKVAGYIKEIKFDVGDRVRQGQLLATLEVPEMGDDLRRADASTERATAEVARASDELQRAESVHQMTHLSYERLAAVLAKRPGLIAQQEIDDAKSRDLVAEAQIAAAKSGLAAARQQVHVNTADASKVKTLMDYTRVTAPFAGVITKRYADMGSMIQAGTASQTQAMPVARLSENSRLRLILPVPESAVPTVHIGQRVEVRVQTLNRTFPGVVARFTDKLNSSTRTMDTEVDVPNASMVLIPGMYAEVDLTLSQRKQVLAVPSAAVDATGQVMVVTADNRVEMRKIETGMETAERVEVKNGLAAGDMVVLAGRASLQVGEAVHPKLTAMSASKE
ncbi:MAG: efflux RND transporter periplasmic adaptor subunit [Candidatus Solibacter sp.]